MHRKIMILMLFLFTVCAPLAFAENDGRGNGKGTTIIITVGDQEIVAELNDSVTSQDFIAMLPMSLSMDRLYDREYYTSLPRKISIDDEPVKEFEIGDVAYWPDWNYFGILFNKTRPLSSPIVVMGRVVSGLEKLETVGQSAEMSFKVQP